MVSRMKKYFEKVETIRSPFAPFYIIRLAKLQARPNRKEQSVLGKGAFEKVANERLYGEAAERLSNMRASAMLEWPLLYTGPSDPIMVDPLMLLGETRRRSHGCAAHNQIADAAKAALIELWERRHVDLWWRGQIQIYPIPDRMIDLWALNEFAQKLRTGAVATRHTRFYVIESASPVTVVAALSFNDSAGDMAIGFAAGFDLIPTLKRAFEELLCVELEVVDLHAFKRTGATLVPSRNREIALRRQGELARRFDNPFLVQDVSFDSPTVERLSPVELIARFADLGLPVHVADITDQDIGLPVCRAFFQNREFNRLFENLNCAPPV